MDHINCSHLFFSCSWLLAVVCAFFFFFFFFIFSSTRFLDLLLWFKMVKFNLHSLRLTFLPCFFFEIFCPLVRGACYYPNGTDMNEFYDFPVKANYSPCNFSSEHVMCCAQWDSCRSDGLCFNKQDSNKEVWRDGCTDPTWKSPSCIKLCLDGCKQISSSKFRFREVSCMLMLIKCFQF